MLKKRLAELAGVMLFLLLASLVFWLTDADLRATALVPHDQAVADVLPDSSRAWPAGNLFPWNLLYKFAPYPAFALAGLALLVFLTGFVLPKIAAWRGSALFVLLFLALGPGLMINVLKNEIGRPRPREVTEFGGRHEFTQCWQPGKAGTNSSFPSGHAAVAFSAMAPWFVLRDRRKKLAAGFLLFGLLYGLLVGMARILQGGHFASDVLWSGGLLYVLGSLINLCFISKEEL